MNVKRWTLQVDPDGDPDMVEWRHGDYVLYEDYEEIRRDFESIKDMIDELQRAAK